MAPSGPLNKINKHGRTPTTVDWIDVPDVAYDGPSPNLPALPRRRKWHPLVEQWWEQVRTMPHTILWRPVDWTYAVETALMKHAYWNAYDTGDDKTTQAVEIRRREDQMGCTQEARRRLRIRYIDPELISDEDLDPKPFDAPVAGGNVTSIADRRARLTG